MKQGGNMEKLKGIFIPFLDKTTIEFTAPIQAFQNNATALVERI
jgi:hypothetical protein